MQITYLFDPLCGWCYGAGPTMQKLASLDDVTLTLAPSGLFAGECARPMDRNFAAFAWENDQRIARLTGQTFSEDYRNKVLDAGNSQFDSAPATLGVVAVGLTRPESELAALKALQEARYVDGINTENLETVAGILENSGFDAAAKLVRVPGEALLAAYDNRIKAARRDMTQFGAQGVPTLIVGEGDNRRMLRGNALYGRFDLLTEELRAA